MIKHYKFKTKPYEHQLEALEKSWAQDTYALFMEMGTGKSKVLVDNIAMLYDKGAIRGALIVAPKGVYKNWNDIVPCAFARSRRTHKSIVGSEYHEEKTNGA